MLVGVVIQVPPLVLVSAAVILKGRGRKPVGGRGPPLGDAPKAEWWTMLSEADGPPAAVEGGR